MLKSILEEILMPADINDIERNRNIKIHDSFLK